MLNQKQRAALNALLQTTNKADAARIAGVSEKSIRNYWNSEEFQKEYSKACSQLLRDATRRAQIAISPTISAIAEIVKNESEQANVRVQAARVLIDSTLKLTEVVDMNSRIAALEEITKNGTDYFSLHP